MMDEVEAILKKYCYNIKCEESVKKKHVENDVICLSDSSDEEIHSPATSQEINDQTKKLYLSDEEIPELPGKKESPIQKLKSSGLYTIDSLDDDDEIPGITNIQKINHNYFIYNNEKHVDETTSSSSQDCSQGSSGSKQGRKRKSPGEKEKEKMEAKAAKLAEKNRLKAEAQREKANRQALMTLNKKLKPDECLKLITVYIDSKIADQKYGGEILNVLQGAEITYRVYQQLLPGTITWNSLVQSQLVDANGQLSLTSQKSEANVVLVMINWDELIDLISKKSFSSFVKELSVVYCNKRLLLGIFGLVNYYKYHKSRKKKEFESEIGGEYKKSRTVKGLKEFEGLPFVNRRDLEDALTEAQLIYNCNHRMVDTPADVAQMVLQVTKSIAQIPYKLGKREKEEQFQMYVTGDNRDCVNVDKNGNGLKRLWAQQLTMFPLARLECAEAIISKYPTPSCLRKVYDDCGDREEGEILLQSIPVRRAAGPLTNDKKIGPELSKKIYKFFNSLDGDEEL